MTIMLMKSAIRFVGVPAIADGEMIGALVGVVDIIISSIIIHITISG
jgi:hypothetical protein